METTAGTPEGVSRRGFLTRVGAVGGATALYGTMEALGLIASPAHAAEEAGDFVPLGPGDLPAAANGTKVVILGAGTAGLTVAYELGKAGYDCHVLEARSKPGGRAMTIRRGDRLTDTDGVTQVCTFDDGHYYNAGPSRIPSHHLTIDYCRELGVELEPMVNANAQGFYYHENTATVDYGELASTRVTHRQAKADVYGYISELLVAATDQGALDQLLSANDAERLVGLANSLGGLTGGKYVGNNRRGYREPPGAGDQPGTVAGPPPSMSAVLQSQLGTRFAFEFGFDQAMMMWQPVGGMDQISAALASAIGGRRRITYDAPVTGIDNTPDGVRVTYRSNGRTRVLDADYCVVTIPPMVLKSIPSNFSPATKDALAVPVGANSGRMGIQFKRRFWEEDFDIYGGVTHTNLDVSGIYYPSYGYFSRKGVLVGYYSGAYTNLPVAERETRALAQGAKIHGDVYHREFDNSFSVAWPKEPHSLGAWVSWPGGRGAAYQHLLQADGNTYFAGDHLSYYTAWQNGAFLSARKVVSDLHARVAATAS
ncbi:flavin monoamine oxidase family protein [Jiangella aurantiaca]|uniref:flavin monoamine oxidase family protein n=1 Tax=Jiangella aurantiaca TaxID=2530373 RepID=UPI00193D604C|nr:flavin monoamine oxidase family protein [Jiangella aurantiaca]